MKKYSLAGDTYLKYQGEERVAMVLRSITQDGCLDFKNDTIDTIFPVKDENDEHDIGKACQKFAMKILGSLQDDVKIQRKLLFFLYIMYEKGRNPDTDKIWHILWLNDASPLFSKKINSLPATGRVSAMASLEKPEKTIGRDIKDIQW